MQLGNYRFICRFTEQAFLPVFKGSTLRGLFGLGLKKAVCVLKHQQCPACLLKDRCLYTRVFDTHLLEAGSTEKRGAGRPHPFVIEPPATTQTDFQPGETLECGLLLFGPYNSQLPYFVYAFQQMGAIGMGKGRGNGRGAFALERIEADGQEIFSSADGRLKTEAAGRELVLAKPAEASPVRRLEINLETPLRFKHEGRLTDALPFHVLARLMLRRISSLMAALNGGEPLLDYKGLVARAQTVQTTAADLKWTDWARYSSRQQTAMQLGGITGAVAYEGELSEYAPLLDFCTAVHIGKQTSFGLGKIKVEETAGV
jgi:hypothetical protein